MRFTLNKKKYIYIYISKHIEKEKVKRETNIEKKMESVREGEMLLQPSLIKSGVWKHKFNARKLKEGDKD